MTETVMSGGANGEGLIMQTVGGANQYMGNEKWKRSLHRAMLSVEFKLPA